MKVYCSTSSEISLLDRHAEVNGPRQCCTAVIRSSVLSSTVSYSGVPLGDSMIQRLSAGLPGPRSLGKMECIVNKLDEVDLHDLASLTAGKHSIHC